MAVVPPVPELDPTATTAVPAPPPPAVPPVSVRAGAPVWILPLVTGIAGLLVGGAAMAAINSSADAAEERAEVRATEEAAAAEEAALDARQAILTDAVETCGLEGADGIDLGDGNTTLTFNMRGEDEVTGASYTDIYCIFAGMAMPSNVSSHIDQTTSVDGRQTESWGDLTISWSYHPDRGLDGILTVEND